MGDSWSCLSCLGAEEPPPRPRRRIDKSLIGLPTDFQHTGHIGSSDFGSSDVSLVQSRMQSKGGYEGKIEVPDAVTPTGTFVVSLVHFSRLNLSGPHACELNLLCLWYVCHSCVPPYLYVIQFLHVPYELVVHEST